MKSVQDRDVLPNELYKLSSIGQLSAVEPEFQRIGYLPRCWNTSADGTGRAYALDQHVIFNEDTELYVTWDPVDYQITYELSGGENSPDNPPTYTIEDEDIVLCAATMEDYDFLGWISAEGQHVTAIPHGSIGEKKLSATWTETLVNLTYDANRPTVFKYEVDGEIKTATAYIVGTIDWSSYPEGVTSENLREVDISPDVTHLALRAFRLCFGLTRVMIPASVISIGSEAFYLCRSMNQFVVDDANPNYKSLNRLLLTKDGKTLLAGVNGEVTIPEGVTSIGNLAFFCCSGLTSVTIPSSVTSIGRSEFYLCNALQRIIIKSLQGTLTIGIKAFGGTNDNATLTFTNMTKAQVDEMDNKYWGLNENQIVTKPDSVQTVFKYEDEEGTLKSAAFSLVEGKEGLLDLESWPDEVTSENLKEAEIGSEVSSIDDYLFNDCNEMTKVSIPGSVSDVGNCTFNYCGKLQSFMVDSSNLEYSSRNGMLLSKDGKSLIAGVNGEAVVPDGVESINDCAFNGCSTLSSVTIPASVSSIGECAFEGCNSIEAYVVDEQNDNYSSQNGALLTKDGKSLIAGVTGNPVIPEGVQVISSYAFCDYETLSSIYIPNSVSCIEDYAFYWCTSLTSFNIPSNVVRIGIEAFYNCSGLMSIDLPNGISDVCDGAFCGCGFTSVEIPASMSCISESVFAGCECLSTVIIPESIKRIGYQAFHGCDLISVTIPSSVIEIGEDAFAYCINMEQVILNEGIQCIGECAFEGCYNLEGSVIIPASVSSIGEFAFMRDTNIDEFIVDASNPRYKSENGMLLSKDGTELINGVNKDVIIPAGVTTIHSAAFNECDRILSIAIPNTVSALNDCTFWKCTSLTNIVLPSSILSIGEYEFLGCRNLKKVTIPQCISSIGDVFRGSADDIETVVVDEGVSKVNDHLFYSCQSLSNVVLPTTLTSIGDRAFLDCYSLKNLDIPNNVKSIGNYAFYGCSALTQLDIPANTLSIGYDAFKDCSSLIRVTIPLSTSSIGEMAFIDTTDKLSVLFIDRTLYDISSMPNYNWRIIGTIIPGK